MMKTRLIQLLVLAMLMMGVPALLQAQVGEVHVTTQDYAALRAGPGQNWDKLAVLPFGETYRAVGRNVEGDWIQIAYTGALEEGARTDFTRDGVTYGWVASWLLVWTGDITALPVDGLELVATARAARPTFVLYPDEYIYVGGVDPSTRVQSPYSYPVRVEITGRVGSAEGGSFYWVQFRMNGQFYWTGTWAIGLRYTPNVADRSYLYTYGRLFERVRTEYNLLGSTFSNINGRWQSLASGEATSCNDIPDNFAFKDRSFTPLDLRLEPIYTPLAAALQEAADRTNDALNSFRAMCANSERIVSSETLRAALDNLKSAEQNLSIISEVLAPLQRRDPLVGTTE